MSTEMVNKILSSVLHTSSKLYWDDVDSEVRVHNSSHHNELKEKINAGEKKYLISLYDPDKPSMFILGIKKDGNVDFGEDILLDEASSQFYKLLLQPILEFYIKH